MAAWAILVVAGTIHGSVGFGANVLAVPMLLLVDPRLVPGPAIVAVLGLNGQLAWRSRRVLALGPLRTAMAGRLVGTAVGVGALGLLSRRGLTITVAATVLAIVAVTAQGLVIRRTGRNLAAAGAVSGFSSATAGIGGPPLAVLYADADGPELRGAMGTLLLVGNLVSLGGLGLGGFLGWEEVRLGLALAPAPLIGLAGSRWLSPVLDRGHTRTAVLALSTAAALGALGRVVVG